MNAPKHMFGEKWNPPHSTNTEFMHMDSKFSFTLLYESNTNNGYPLVHNSEFTV